MKTVIRLACIIICFALLSLNIAFAQDATPSPTHRILAISTIPPLEPPLSGDEFAQRIVKVMKMTADAGVTGNLTSAAWSKLEPAPGQYALDDTINELNYRTITFNDVFELSIQVINTTTKETPADLLDKPFDAPEMISRFHALIDALLVHLNHNIYYLSIGNEVDAYLSTHPDAWKTYTAFYTDAVNYVHQKAPWIQVGVTVTFSGAQQYQTEINDLVQASDVIILTYYPLEANFRVRAADAPLTDFPKMLDLAGDRPLVLQEVGYPTSDKLGSSEADQAAFVTNVFDAWQQAGDRIPFLSFFALGDLSDEMTNQFGQYYGLPQNENFLAYLRTLGLFQVDGTPKQGWQAFQDGAAQLVAQQSS